MEAGADGVAVYLGRLMRLERDWEKQLETIAAIVKSAGRTLLLASFPDRQTVEIGLRYSRDITAPPSVLDRIARHPPCRRRRSKASTRKLHRSADELKLPAPPNGVFGGENAMRAKNRDVSRRKLLIGCALGALTPCIADRTGFGGDLRSRRFSSPQRRANGTHASSRRFGSDLSAESWTRSRRIEQHGPSTR